MIGFFWSTPAAWPRRSTSREKMEIGATDRIKEGREERKTPLRAMQVAARQLAQPKEHFHGTAFLSAEKIAADLIQFSGRSTKQDRQKFSGWRVGRLNFQGLWTFSSSFSLGPELQNKQALKESRIMKYFTPP